MGGNHVYSNTATTASNSGYGGGLRLEDGNVTLIDNWIGHNTASKGGLGFGGGLSLINGDGSIIAINRVFSNTASTIVTTTASYGGGLHLYDSDVMVEGNEVWNNAASSSGTGLGGGVFVYGGSPTLIENSIYGNTAGEASFNYGGGIDLDSSAATVQANFIFENRGSTSANGLGGGVSVRYSDDATLSGNFVHSNTGAVDVDGFGGGLYLKQSDAHLSGNRVLRNVASVSSWGYGGGVYILESAPTLTNDMVADNQAHESGVGAGILVHGSSPHLEHITIANNTGGDGSGIHVYSDSGGPLSHPTVLNCIIAGHTVGVTITTNSTAALESTLWWDNDTHWGPGISRSHDYFGDPYFIPLGVDDYHIGAGSAALDRGYPNSIATDIDNAPRPQGPATDLGADEATFVHIPMVLKRMQ
jgi:hypothetical protein